jgi:SagB-type dehydrogenase family enzyme
MNTGTGIMSIGEEFIIKTRYGIPAQTDQLRGIPSPPIEEDFSGTIIPLPDRDTGSIADVDISVAIENRESIRNYHNTPLSLEELSYLLWCTQGIKWVLDDSTFRTVPSAGARHAIDTYLYVKNVNGLHAGIYRFLALDHSLGLISDNDGLSDRVNKAGLEQRCIQEAAVCFIWVANSYRMTWRYGERGFRDIFLDAGHICQNLYLSSQAIGCGVCAIGAFKDDEMNTLLSLDGEKKFTLYMATVGKIPNEE